MLSKDPLDLTIGTFLHQRIIDSLSMIVIESYPQEKKLRGLGFDGF
tara:strand:- start:35 stop:172 length:138 start_codon:yes stop_codon:yes gene_type:complete